MSDRSPHSPAPAWLTDLGWAERYEVLAPIGRGGMGQVWKARDRLTQEVVALKIIDPTRAGDDQLLARFDIEATALMLMRDTGNNQHIVPVLAFKQTETLACIVMAFIPGMDLRRWCDVHSLGLRDRAGLLALAARAAGHCHEQGIIHRDLKPANILVHEATREPVIVDFSIAKTDGQLQLTLTGETLGTAPYMAPEQLNSQHAEITFATDVYALGAALYELITSIHPHPGTLTQVIDRHRTETRPAKPSAINPTVPADLECICLKALAHRPADRYANGTLLADDLDRFLAGEPVQARPLSKVAYLIRQARLHAALTTMIVVAAALGVAALIGLQQAWHERRVNVIEQEISALMQGKEWGRISLLRADALLEQLADAKPERKVEMRAAVTSDVRDDVLTALQQAQFSVPNAEQVRPSILWLAATDPEEAKRLDTLVTERLGRWETTSSARAPFTSKDGLFPRSHIKVQGDLLFPDHGDTDAFSPAITVKEAVAAPVEIIATFVPSASGFHHVAISLDLEQIRTEAILYQVLHAPKSILAQFDGQPLDKAGAVFYIQKQRGSLRAIYLPDVKLTREPFQMTLRVERNQVHADINGRWSLNVDDVFAVTSQAPINRCRISWPRDLGLREITIRNRVSTNPHLLEKADLLMVQHRYAEAQRAYESLAGDHEVSAEASFKASLAHYRQDQIEPARQLWESVSQGKPSLWRDLGLFWLWQESVINRGTKAARPYLQRLPAPADLSPMFHSGISASVTLSHHYSLAGEGLNVLSNNPSQTEDAIKAYQVLGMRPVVIANEFGLAQHFSGLDDHACKLFTDGLSDAIAKVESASTMAVAVAAMDQWLRVAPSEREPLSRNRLLALRKALPKDDSLKALADIEQARIKARAGDYPHALKIVEEIRHRSGVAARQVVEAALIEGEMLRLAGDKPKAQAAWLRGIAAGRASKTHSTMDYFDRISLHCLTKTWNAEVCAEVLVPLVGRTVAGEEGKALQNTFVRSFLSDPNFITSLNTIVFEARGRQTLFDGAIAAECPRNVCRAVVGLMLERYFITIAYDNESRVENLYRARTTVQELMLAAVTGDPTDPTFYTFIQALSDPALGVDLNKEEYGCPPRLASRLRWLLAQRYLLTHHADAAEPLLQAALDDPSLGAKWRNAIQEQLQATAKRR